MLLILSVAFSPPGFSNTNTQSSKIVDMRKLDVVKIRKCTEMIETN